jgi:hypothetical protein
VYPFHWDISWRGRDCCIGHSRYIKVAQIKLIAAIIAMFPSCERSEVPDVVSSERYLHPGNSRHRTNVA